MRRLQASDAHAYSPYMAQDSDLTELARNYLDLWEEQMSDYVQNPDTARYWTQYWGRIMEAMTQDQFRDQKSGNPGRAAEDKAGTSTVATAPDPRLDELERLAGRITALENAVGKLQSRSAGKPENSGQSAGTRAKTRRPGPKSKQPKSKQPKSR